MPTSDLREALGLDTLGGAISKPGWKRGGVGAKPSMSL